MFLAGFLPLSIHCIQGNQHGTTGHSTRKLPTLCHNLCRYKLDMLPKVSHSFLHCYLRFLSHLSLPHSLCLSHYLCHGHFFLVFHFFSLWSHNLHHFFFSVCSHNLCLHHHFFFSLVFLVWMSHSDSFFLAFLFSSLLFASFFSAFSAANLFFSSSSFLRTSMASSEVRLSP